jgi:hypothetical protein
MAWAPALAHKPSYNTHCMPLALHGDGVPLVKGKSLYVINAVSLLGIGTNIDVKMLLTCYWSHLKEKEGLAQFGFGHRGHSVEVHPMGSGCVLQWCASKR